MITPRGARPVAIRRWRLARVLVLAAVLAAMSLGVSAVAHAQTTGNNAEELFRQGERDFQNRDAAADAEELFRQGERDFQDQATRWAPTNRVDAPVRQAGPGRPPAWLVPALGGLAAALAVLGGLILLAARRTRLKVRPHQAT